jgi:hypothetical protein
MYTCFQYIFQFQTQQIYCVRDREGGVTDGGQVGNLYRIYLSILFYMFVMCGRLIIR